MICLFLIQISSNKIFAIKTTVEKNVELSVGIRIIGRWRTDFSFNRPFPSCCEPYYESEAKCKTIHMKISFVCI